MQIARRAEPTGEPAQLLLEPGGFGIIDQLRKHRDRRAHPPQADAHLMHALWIGGAHRGFVGAHLPEDRCRDQLKRGAAIDVLRQLDRFRFHRRLRCSGAFGNAALLTLGDCGRRILSNGAVGGSSHQRPTTAAAIRSAKPCSVRRISNIAKRLLSRKQTTCEPYDSFVTRPLVAMQRLRSVAHKLIFTQHSAANEKAARHMHDARPEHGPMASGT